MNIIAWDIAFKEDILQLWNKEIGTAFPLREELLRQNSFEDENILPEGSFMAFNEEGKMIGFVIAKTWQEKLNVSMNKEIGWIQALLVDSAHRGRGIGQELLRKAETALMNAGVKKIHLGRDPWHYFPGIPDEYSEVKAWFEKREYSYIGNEYDLICEYNPDEKAALPVQEEVTFSLLKEEEKEQLIHFLHRCFPGRWEYEAIHYFKKGGTGREFVVLKKSNEIIGFCRINDAYSPFIAQNVYWAPLFKEELGGIGPLGVDSNERKKGYGLAIVEAGIHFLRERDIHKIAIDWTGLVNFYGKLGYVPWKKYAQYSKSFSEL